MLVPDELRYTAEHEWVRIEGAAATVGITDYAQDQLGDVVYVALPTVGATVAAGEACAEIESTKSVSAIYSPVAGRITAANDALGATPESVNDDPYGAGWIFVVEMSEPVEPAGLLDAAAYAALTE